MLEFEAGTIAAKLRGLNTVLQIAGLDNRANLYFARMGPIIDAEYMAFETARQKLVEQHAQRDENDELLKESDDNTGRYIMVDAEAFEAEYQKLAKEILAVNAQPVRASLLLASEGCVNGATMILLGELIEDDVEEEEEPKAPVRIVKPE